MKSKKIAKVGDTIKWSFDKNQGTVLLAGKTFEAKVAMVSLEDKVYGVYAEYGQDKIPFGDATIVKVKVKSFCECEISYFPTGNIKWCSKCEKPTVY